MTLRTGAVIVLVTTCVVSWPAVSAAQTARELYTQALGRERDVRDAGRAPTLRQIRNAVASREWSDAIPAAAMQTTRFGRLAISPVWRGSGSETTPTVERASGCSNS
jgi:hypothetical protein